MVQSETKMIIDPILEKAFEPERLERIITKMNDEKNLNKTILRSLCNPEFLLNVYMLIKNGKYEISPPHIVLIPKDEPGKFRECKVNEPYDRCILALLNDTIMELTSDTMIAPQCTSYQKGLSSQRTVQNSVEQIPKLIKKHKRLGHTRFILKADLSKYFDRVFIERIDEAFDKLEMFFGFKPNTLPSVSLLRKYYHSDWLFGVDGTLINQYTALKQGSSSASWLADVILYDMDVKLNELCDFYTRYSDDILIISENVDEIKTLMEEMLATYGLELNPKKLEFIDPDKWFTFLGFKIRGEQITLSKNRVKKLQKEIVSRTLNKPNITEKQAKANVVKYLYGNADDFSWGTACLGTVNVEADLIEIDNFIKDCLRACKIRETERRKSKVSIADIGGLGSVDNLPDRTILRGKGRRVRTYRDHTDKTIQNYKTLNCLRKAYQMNVNIYESVVRSI